MTSRACENGRGSGFQRGARALGWGACAVALIASCAKERQIGGGGDGGTAGSTTGTGGSSSSSSSGSSSSGSSSSSSSSSSSGTGGAACETPDPDCECVGGQVVARDVDADQHGSRLCEANAGDDCDDGDPNFVVNECGGCNKNLGGQVGAPCGQCGIFECLGDSALACASPIPAPKKCSGNTVQVCSQGTWTDETMCSGGTPFCLTDHCVVCKPGTFTCGTVLGTPVVIPCEPTGSWSSSWTLSCSSLQTCDAASGTCVGLFHPRDADFEVPRLLRDPPGMPAPGLRTGDVLDAALGIAFG